MRWSLRSGCALSFALLLIVSDGCARREHPSPPPPVARVEVDTLVAAHAPQLGEWLSQWRRAAPEFELNQLERNGPAPFTLLNIVSYNPRDPMERQRRLRYGVFAPDSTRFIDPDVYREITMDPGGPAIGRDANSAPRLVDLATHSVTRLVDCGTACGNDDAFWIDRLRFVLMGWSEADTLGNLRAELRFYDLGNGMLTTFSTPPVSRDAFGHYVAASDSAILRRDAARASAGTPHGT
jgi:hypothetical protein